MCAWQYVCVTQVEHWTNSKRFHFIYIRMVFIPTSTTILWYLCLRCTGTDAYRFVHTLYMLPFNVTSHSTRPTHTPHTLRLLWFCRFSVSFESRLCHMHSTFLRFPCSLFIRCLCVCAHGTMRENEGISIMAMSPLSRLHSEQTIAVWHFERLPKPTPKDIITE